MTSGAPWRRERVLAALLAQALAAQRADTLAPWLAQRTQSGHKLLAPLLALMRASAGEALPPGREPAVRLLLRWLMLGLRPDHRPGVDGIDASAWLRRPAWRPALATLCQHGLLAVPDFPGHYRGQGDEPAIERLCRLWDLAPSTVYRDLERAQAAMLRILLERPLSVPHRLALRQLAAELLPADADARAQAHRGLAAQALQSRDPASALWHAQQAGDLQPQLELLREHATTLAFEPETDALVARAQAAAATPRLQAGLWLARAVLARARNQAERERAAIETAQRIAAAADDAPLLGMASAALGKYHEARDGDRAFACYERSVALLVVGDAGVEGFELEALRSLLRLAWLYALRQHPRTRQTLEQADRLAAAIALGARDRALLDDAWAEYRRLAGEHAQAIELRQRALLGFEEAGDRRQVLATLLNLVLSYGHAQDSARALATAQRFFALAQAGDVEPEMLVNAHGNVGIAHFLRGDLALAEQHYRQALQCALAADLRLHAHRNRYNLAEALYQRAARGGDAQAAAQADELVQELLAAPPSEATEPLQALARTLRSEVLAPAAAPLRDQLRSEESAAHFEASAEIERQRALLAQPVPAAAQLQARLRIAEAYLAMAASERDQALALAARHGLQAQAAAQAAGLWRSFARAQPRELALAAHWARAAGELLDDARRLALASRLLRDGTLSKASYGEAAGVAPATASRHLGLLVARGLLQALGRGPATRYRIAPGGEAVAPGGEAVAPGGAGEAPGDDGPAPGSRRPVADPAVGAAPEAEPDPQAP